MTVGPFELTVELITEITTTLLELQDKEPRAWRATVKHGSIRRKIDNHPYFRMALPCVFRRKECTAVQCRKGRFNLIKKAKRRHLRR